jgi:hypothetical protein
LIAWIFQGGPAPNPLCSADINCSCSVDISDVVGMVQIIFMGGEMECDCALWLELCR